MLHMCNMRMDMDDTDTDMDTEMITDMDTDMNTDMGMSTFEIALRLSPQRVSELADRQVAIELCAVLRLLPELGAHGHWQRSG